MHPSPPLARPTPIQPTPAPTLAFTRTPPRPPYTPEQEFDIGEYGDRLLNNFDSSERVGRGAKQSKRADAGESAPEP